MPIFESAATSHPGAFRLEAKIVRLVERARAEQRTTGLLAALLMGFGICWLAFDVGSLASLDPHLDLSEMSVWAQNFAFGYKHPPLSAWIFSLWFSVFPRAAWAAHLLAATTVTLTLAITWRLLRDHLDFNRALVGVASLVLVPLYTFQAIKFNANLVMMPFWAAALLYYLRARSGFRVSDAALAGACAGFAFLGKYWAIYLIAGMAVAAFTGPTARRFWRSPAPYAMAVSAFVVVAPHLHWFLTERGSDTDNFLFSLASKGSFRTDLAQSLSYLLGTIAYIGAPLLFFAALRPGRAAVADTLCPREESRRLALILLLAPLLLPALLNLVLPHRLTPLWTFPNWAILPVVLFSSPLLDVPALAAVRGVLVAALVSIAAVIASPLVGYSNLHGGSEPHRPHWRKIAETIDNVSGGKVRLLSGDDDITRGLPFYLAKARLLQGSDLSTIRPVGIGEAELAIVCRRDDTVCQSRGDALRPGTWTDFTSARHFLGFSGPEATYRIKIVPVKP